MSIITKTLKNGGYFAINKHLIKSLGLQEAVILSLFIDKADYYDGEMFFYTLEDIGEAVGGGISEREIRAIIKSLTAKNLLTDMGMIGIPAKRFFMINEIKISELFDTTSTSKNDTNSPCKNDTNSPCKNDRARNIKNDRANIINPHITNPNNTNPNIQEEKFKKEIEPKKTFEISKYPNLNLEAFEMWCEYKGKAYSLRGKILSANMLAKFELSVQQAMVDQSIKNDWAGLFELRSYQNQTNQQALNECYKHSTDHSDWLDAKINEASKYEWSENE